MKWLGNNGCDRIRDRILGVIDCTAWIPTGVPGTAFPAVITDGTPLPPQSRTTGAEVSGYVGTCASWEDRCPSTLSVARPRAVLSSPRAHPSLTQQPWRKRSDDSFTGKDPHRGRRDFRPQIIRIEAVSGICSERGSLLSAVTLVPSRHIAFLIFERENVGVM
ncbi:hypothetical protein CDAR_189951 [Caerostris darwini]|uniref:Uncharacterized protein n=1 Tax=Caerostris darwini TaxID=1538125 RepID=A0AAV4QLC3_9ARAC|nr:hypothetical protein CDAR_189951 [Caerostris darwini]